jgi:predicted Zn-dependent protease
MLPLWKEGEVAPSLPTCPVRRDLERLPRTTVALVRFGGVPDAIADAIGDVVWRELSLPTCLLSQRVALPSPTRTHLLGKQWSLESLRSAFQLAASPFPDAPLKYLLISPVDIYTSDTNFVFSASYSWGAVVSYKRFGDLETDFYQVAHSAAKQTLGALVKSFDVPRSIDPNCVTSYTNGLDQFEEKGNRPSDETLELFLNALSDENQEWIASRRAAGGQGSRFP